MPIGWPQPQKQARILTFGVSKSSSRQWLYSCRSTFGNPWNPYPWDATISNIFIPANQDTTRRGQDDYDLKRHEQGRPNAMGNGKDGMNIKVCPSFSILLEFFYLLIDYVTYRVPIPDDYRCSDSTSPPLITFFWVTPPEYQWHASAGVFLIFWNFVHHLAIVSNTNNALLWSRFSCSVHIPFFIPLISLPLTQVRDLAGTLSRVVRICQFISVCIIHFSFISIYCWHNGWFNYYWVLSLIDSLVSCMFCHITHLSWFLTVILQFQTKFYRCLLFPTLCKRPLLVNIPPRIGRSLVLRPQDLETRYWLRAPFDGLSHSMRDIAATSLAVGRFPFGDQSDPLHMVYTIFYLDQVNFRLPFFWSHYWPAEFVDSPLAGQSTTALKILV